MKSTTHSARRSLEEAICSHCEAADLCEHRHAVEAVDRVVRSRRLGEHLRVEEITPDHEGGIIGEGLASALALLLCFSHLPRRLPCGSCPLRARSDGKWRSSAASGGQ